MSEQSNTSRTPRVLVVSDGASARMGGESVIPIEYFGRLRARGVEAWMVVHDRTRAELEALFPDDRHRIHYVCEKPLHTALNYVGVRLPQMVNHATCQFVVRMDTQQEARRIVRGLVARHGIDVVHQPTPISPKEVSQMGGLGCAVVIGPMNGGMRFPPAFADLQGRGLGTFVKAGRGVATVLNRLTPGKLRAQTLLVANERTRRALPQGVRGRIVTMTENGVDVSQFRLAAPEARGTGGGPVRLLFVGRLVDWKGADLLLHALAGLGGRADVVLDVIGDGPERPRLERLATDLGVAPRVTFRGWVAMDRLADEYARADAFVLPSVYEAGGAVILQAMAAGLPVVATRWGGPCDYVTDGTTGVLVEPADRGRFVADLADAIARLAGDADLRRAMGRAGRARVEAEFDWAARIDRILEVYRDAAARYAAEHGAASRPAAGAKAPRNGRHNGRFKLRGR